MRNFQRRSLEWLELDATIDVDTLFNEWIKYGNVLRELRNINSRRKAKATRLKKKEQRKEAEAGHHFCDLVWDNIKQFLGIGKYYVADWRVGVIYYPQSSFKNGPSIQTPYWMKGPSYERPWDGPEKWRNRKRICWKLTHISKSRQRLTFEPIAFIKNEYVEDLYYDSDLAFFKDWPIDSPIPIGEKIKLPHVLYTGYGLYNMRKPKSVKFGRPDFNGGDWEWKKKLKDQMRANLMLNGEIYPRNNKNKKILVFEGGRREQRNVQWKTYLQPDKFFRPQI